MPAGEQAPRGPGRAGLGRAGRPDYGVGRYEAAVPVGTVEHGGGRVPADGVGGDGGGGGQGVRCGAHVVGVHAVVHVVVHAVQGGGIIGTGTRGSYGTAEGMGGGVVVNCWPAHCFICFLKGERG